MNAPHGENESLFAFKAEVEAELASAEASHPEEAVGLPITEWLFDPTDVEREEIGLRGLLGAIEALEGDARPDDHHA